MDQPLTIFTAVAVAFFAGSLFGFGVMLHVLVERRREPT